MDFIDNILSNLDPSIQKTILKILDGKSINPEEAYSLHEIPIKNFQIILLIAYYLTEKEYHKIISYSKNVFIDLTHLCRNNCGYCAFRQEPTGLDSLILKPKLIIQRALEGKRLGCKEALVTLGEKPELKYKIYRDVLHSFGNYSTTSEYLRDICEKIINETGLLPHSNPGILDREEIKELKEVNASLGLMLENSSTKLLNKKGPHEFSPGKDPQLRINTIKIAGDLKIPFTTGILIGIGETYTERIDSIYKIKELNDKFGHIQEIIIQNFIPHKNTPMAKCNSPSLNEILKIIAITRIIFNGKMNIQVPPNLNQANLSILLKSGINDWGGISPLTEDYINPGKIWPSIQKLTRITKQAGLTLKERLPIYPEFVRKDNFISNYLRDQIRNMIDENGFVKSSDIHETSKR